MSQPPSNHTPEELLAEAQKKLANYKLGAIAHNKGILKLLRRVDHHRRRVELLEKALRQVGVDPSKIR